MAAETNPKTLRVDPSKRSVTALGIALAILFSVIGYGFWKRGKQEEAALTIRGRTPPIGHSSPATTIQTPGKVEASSLVPDDPKVALPAPPMTEVVVHIAGAVKSPGLYRFPVGTRIADGIKKAGGQRSDADLDGINLAERLEDGKQVVVPQKQLGSTAVLAAKSAGGTRRDSAESTKSGKFSLAGRESLNLNSANAEQLQRLPGVGPAMAERILSHRKENGPFTDPEQLMDVSGIGEKKFARMKPFVRVR